MGKENNKYQYFTNSLNNELYKANVIDIDEGFISIFVLLKEPCTYCCKVVDFIHSKFEQYFKYQQYTNPKLIVAESIAHVGRQIYLQATHDESFYGLKASCLVTYYREKELLIAQVGDLEIKQLILSNTSSEYELINTNQSPKNIDFLKIDNFHEIVPFIFQVIPSSGDAFVISQLGFFENHTEQKKLFDQITKTTNSTNNNEPLNSINFPVFYLKILKTRIVKHSNDNSIVKQITSLSYFANIPKMHLFVLMAVISILALLVFIVRPQDFIQKKEREVLRKAENLIKKDLAQTTIQVDSAIHIVTSNEAIIQPIENVPNPVVVKRDTIAAYTVDADETLYRISKNFNVSISDVSILNKLDNNVLRTGQKILVPVQAIYKVEDNITLYEIANQYKISVAKLMACNQLIEPNIESGMFLLIPKNE
jgi:LysM repeat protein